ncbi:hypothetical protein HGA34_02715 [Candidatus Falkowbacteria bacterium]|nr:hypothetical protein [Candidatus Falkowbacteria bacterium]
MNEIDIRVMMGSESDAEQANKVLAILRKIGVTYKVTIASCHRNIGGEFEELAKTIEERVILMIGGMSFAAPGIMSSLLRNGGKLGHVIIAVPLDEAARSAIEDLPKGTVVLTCGLNRSSVSHSIENATLAAVQLNAIFRLIENKPQPMMNYAAYVDSTAKKLIQEAVLDENGLIPLPSKNKP